MVYDASLLYHMADFGTACYGSAYAVMMSTIDASSNDYTARTTQGSTSSDRANIDNSHLILHDNSCQSTENSSSHSTAQSQAKDDEKDAEQPASGVRRVTTIDDGHVDPLDNPQGQVKYKTMSWWHVGMLMIAETISLGILSLPGAVAALGLIPGILSILLLGLLATYSGYVIGQFKLRHPLVHSFADVGLILFGKIGHCILCVAALLSLIFIMAAHILTFSVAMNVLTGHAACNMLWAVLGTLICFLLTLPRTLKNVSYFSIVSFLSITSAVFLVVISLGITNRGSDHVEITDIYLFLPSYAMTPTFLALLNICIAYMGNVAFFGFISELRDPSSFPKALMLMQTISIVFYLTIGCIIYSFVGTANIVSPALGSASPLIQKIAYGIAMPTIIVAGVINAHVSCKQVYIQFWQWKGEAAVVSKKDAKAVCSWIVVVGSQWIIALVLALSIPVFEQMLGLISALFGSWFTYGICGFLWINLNKEKIFGLKWKAYFGKMNTAMGKTQHPQETCLIKRLGKQKLGLLILNIGMICLGAVLCFLGLYTSITTIINSELSRPFSCGSL